MSNDKLEVAKAFFSKLAELRKDPVSFVKGRKRDITQSEMSQYHTFRMCLLTDNTYKMTPWVYEDDIATSIGFKLDGLLVVSFGSACSSYILFNGKVRYSFDWRFGEDVSDMEIDLAARKWVSSYEELVEPKLTKPKPIMPKQVELKQVKPKPVDLKPVEPVVFVKKKTCNLLSKLQKLIPGMSR